MLVWCIKVLLIVNNLGKFQLHFLVIIYITRLNYSIILEIVLDAQCWRVLVFKSDYCCKSLGVVLPYIHYLGCYCIAELMLNSKVNPTIQ